MKNIKFAILTLLLTWGSHLLAQNQPMQHQIPYERYGNTLNLGVGIGYYGYVNQTVGVFHADYEIGVAKSFTLAPFIEFYTYDGYNYYMGQEYYYHQTVIPIGAKGTYYLDRLLHTNPNWDIYVAASLGLIIRNTSWQTGYYGETNINNGSGDLYLNLHAGAEFHASRRLGIYLDLSTGVSTIGISIHHW